MPEHSPTLRTDSSRGSSLQRVQSQRQGLEGRGRVAADPWLTDLALALIPLARARESRRLRVARRESESKPLAGGLAMTESSRGMLARTASPARLSGLGATAGVDPIWLRCQLAAALKELSPMRRRWVLLASRAGWLERLAILLGRDAVRDTINEFTRRLGGSEERLLPSLIAIAGRPRAPRVHLARIAVATGFALLIGGFVGHATATYSPVKAGASSGIQSELGSRIGTAGLRGGAIADRARLRAAELAESSADAVPSVVRGRLTIDDSVGAEARASLFESAVVLASSTLRSEVAVLDADGSFEFHGLGYGYWRLDLMAQDADARSLHFRLTDDEPEVVLDLEADVVRQVAVHAASDPSSAASTEGPVWGSLLCVGTEELLTPGAEFVEDASKPLMFERSGLYEADRGTLLGHVSLPAGVGYVALIADDRVLASAPVDARLTALHLDLSAR